jgi:TetR/AcrR family transcriptional repressor of nem operon
MTKSLPTKERLLRSAIRLFMRHGYQVVSVDAICADASAHKGSFYHAYESKADILCTALERIWHQNRSEILQAVAESSSPMDRLERHLDWFLQSQRRLLAEEGYAPGHFNLVFDWEVPRAVELSHLYRQEHSLLLRESIAGVVKLQRASADIADTLTRVIERMIHGTILEVRLTNSLKELEDLKPLVLQLVTMTALVDKGSTQGQ